MATVASFGITSAAVSEVQDRDDAKSRYVFKLEISWSNGEITTCLRGYQEFFEFHCILLDTFPSEAGISKEGERSLPFLPGKQVFRKSNKTLALKRLPELDQYVKELVELPEHISRCEHVLRFLRDDWDEEALHMFRSKRTSSLGETEDMERSQRVRIDAFNNRAIYVRQRKQETLGKDTCDTAPLTANDFGTGVDVRDVREASKDENLVEEVQVNYVGYGFGEGNYEADNAGGGDYRDDESSLL